MTGMKMTIPLQNQNQMYMVSYGWHEGNLYMRSIDHSDGETKWWKAHEKSLDLAMKWDDGNQWEEPSKKIKWVECQAPEAALANNNTSRDLDIEMEP